MPLEEGYPQLTTGIPGISRDKELELIVMITICHLDSLHPSLL